MGLSDIYRIVICDISFILIYERTKMEIAGLFLWLIIVSVIFTVYAKIAERFGGFRAGTYYLLLLTGAACGVVYLFSLIIVFYFVPYEFILNSFLLVGSALAAIIRFAGFALFAGRKKGLNRFQFIAASAIIGLGFFIVEIYISILFMKSFVFSNVLLIIPINTLVSSIIGLSGGKSSYESVRSGLVAVLINCIAYYVIALFGLYKNSWFYLIILSAIVLLCIAYTVTIARKAFRESVQ